MDIDLVALEKKLEALKRFHQKEGAEDINKAIYTELERDRSKPVVAGGEDYRDGYDEAIKKVQNLIHSKFIENK